MDFTQVSTVVAIVVITYLIGLGAKAIPQIKDNYIPIIVGVAGSILGVVGMYVIPDFPAIACFTQAIFICTLPKYTAHHLWFQSKKWKKMFCLALHETDVPMVRSCLSASMHSAIP